MSTEDVKRAYHAGALPGCASTLSTHWGYHLQPDGRLVWSPVLQLGCTSRTCLGTCDKARSGMCLDGSLFRFNCAHFGQKLAGVPLFRLMEAFARLCIGHVARRGLPALSKARRHGRPPDPSQPCPDGGPLAPACSGVPPGCALGPLLAFLYVYDLLTARNIFPHGPCTGIVGG